MDHLVNIHITSDGWTCDIKGTSNATWQNVMSSKSAPLKKRTYVLLVCHETYYLYIQVTTILGFIHCVCKFQIRKACSFQWSCSFANIPRSETMKFVWDSMAIKGELTAANIEERQGLVGPISVPSGLLFRLQYLQYRLAFLDCTVSGISTNFSLSKATLPFWY